MTDTDFALALGAFDAAIARHPGKDAPWQALRELVAMTVGAKLFTVMTVDMEKELAARVFTSHPAEYPVSGTKPIHYDAWFDIVHKQRRPFVANTIADIAKVFPDYETIASLGCGSVINLPVEIGGAMVGTINLLDVENYYTTERVELAKRLSLAAKTAYLAAAYFEARA